MGGARRRGDLAALLGLALALLGFFLWPFVLHAERFPLGPDGPVYLWWTRLAGHDGLAAVRGRPGVPALALVLGGTLRADAVPVVAALEVALGTALGLGAAALVRPADGTRLPWLLGGVLAGTFAAHLAAGWLANLAFAAAFVAAAAILLTGRPAALWPAAAALAGGGLAHPLFLLVGVAVLGGTALLALRAGERGEARAAALAGALGAAGAGAGLLALLPGPDPPAVDTSKDAFLRRAGLWADLRAAYLDRLRHRWARYVQWLSLPLAAGGAGSGPALLPPPVRRFLLAWLVLTLAGAAVSIAGGLLPADRFLTFGYAVPLLAGAGLVRAARWAARPGRPAGRLLAGLLVAGLGSALVLGAALAWRRQQPFLSATEVDHAGRAAALATRFPGRPLVFVVNDDDETVTFLATRAGNVIRAAMPPARIRDVVVFVGAPSDYLAGRPTIVGSRERDEMSRISLQDVGRAARDRGAEPAAFLLEPFARPDADDAARLGEEVTPGVFLLEPGLPATAAPGPAPSPLRPSSPGAIAAASALTLLLLGAVGWPWARIGLGRGWPAVAAAPAAGVGLLALAAVVGDRLGVPLAGSAGPTAISASAALGGEVLRRVLERSTGGDPPP